MSSGTKPFTEPIFLFDKIHTNKIHLKQKCSWYISCKFFKLWVNFPECQWINTLRPRQNGRHFPDDIFKCIFLNENVWISIKNSLKFVPKGPINNIPALVQMMAWRRPGDKPLSEPMLVSLPMHLCVTRPQWVNGSTAASVIHLKCQNGTDRFQSQKHHDTIVQIYFVYMKKAKYICCGFF